MRINLGKWLILIDSIHCLVTQKNSIINILLNIDNECIIIYYID